MKGGLTDTLITFKLDISDFFAVKHQLAHWHIVTVPVGFLEGFLCLMGTPVVVQLVLLSYIFSLKILIPMTSYTVYYIVCGEIELKEKFWLSDFLPWCPRI